MEIDVKVTYIKPVILQLTLTCNLEAKTLLRVEASDVSMLMQLRINEVRVSGVKKALPFVQTVDVGRTVIQVGVDSGSRRLVEVISQARSNGFTVEDISVAKPSLGDAFLKYTGRRLRDTDSPLVQNRMMMGLNTNRQRRTTNGCNLCFME